MLETRASEERFWGMVNEILYTEKFRLNQPIVWTRESKGKTVKKHGTIVAIVAPDRWPNQDEFPSLYGRHPESGKDIGKTRKDYSYVIKWKDGSISWPLAMYLSAAEEPVGKPLVEVFAEEEGTRIAKGVTEAYSGLDEKARLNELDRAAYSAKHPDYEEEPVFHSPNDPGKLMGDPEVYGGLDKHPDDDIEDVESQVERNLSTSGYTTADEEAFLTHSAPQISRLFNQDGDGHIKTDSDPDRELGHHLRGVLRILSEAFFGKKKTPDTNAYIKELEESIKSQDVWRDEISRLQSIISARDSVILELEEGTHSQLEASHWHAMIEGLKIENARLQERIKKEMECQTKSATYGDAAVDKLRKELEFKTSMLAESETAVKKLTDDRYSLSQEVENWKDQYTDLLEKSGKLQDNYNLLKSAEVTPETADIFTLKEEVKRYKGICETLSDQIEKLETYAEKREEQIAGWLEKIESLEADAKDAKTKNAVLPEPAVKFLQSEVIRLKGELDASKEAVEHFRTQSVSKPKSGKKVTSDEATVKDALEFAMNKTAAAWSADPGYSHAERQVDAMYESWVEEAK
jgi:archaellum component FlaC